MNEQQAASMVNQQQQQQHMCMSQGQMMNMNFRQQMQQPPMMNRKFGVWPQLPPVLDQSQMQFDPNAMNHQGFVTGKQHKLLGVRNTWKGKKVVKNDNRMDGGRRKEKSMMVIDGCGGGGNRVGAGAVNGVPVGTASAPGGYQPPTLNELQWQNRIKARKFFHKKKIHNYNNYNNHNHNNNNNNNNSGNNRKAPFAPRNTTSFLIRAKKSGGIASLVSPCPVTPAVLPTPILSPSREVLVDMAKEEWGVDGYGSMKGLIRLRSPGQEIDDDDDQGEGGSSESDVEEHVEVERRLDHDLSRFEMIYPNCAMEYNNALENRVDDQDSHIAQLEEENLLLKERLFLMERELGDLTRRLHSLERQSRGGDDDEELLENDSENDSDSHGDTNSVEDNNLEPVMESVEGDDGRGKLNTIDRDNKREQNDVVMETETLNDDKVAVGNTEETKECVDEMIGNDILEKEDDDLEGKEGHKVQGIELKEYVVSEVNLHEKQQIEDAKVVKDNCSGLMAEDVNMPGTSQTDDGILPLMHQKDESEGNE